EVADFYRRLFVGDGFNFQPIPDAEPVNGRLTMDGETALYGCKGGLCEVDLSAAPPAFRRPIPLTRDDATTALRDASGNLWINYTGKAAVRWSATGAVQELPFDVAGGHYFLDRDTDGRVWIPSTNRLAIWRGGAFETTEPKHGLPARIRAMKITRDGTLWLGTETRGLYRWASRGWNWETWTEAQGLDEVWSVLPRSRTDVLAGGNGLLKLSPERERWLRVPGTESLRFLTHLLPRPDGRILAGLYWGWMALLSAGGQVLFRPQERYISGMRLVQFPDGEVWMGNYPVMRAIPSGESYEFRPLQVPGVGGMIASQDMELDARGRPWVCHNAGLSIRLSADEWKTVTTKDGLLQNWCRAIAVRGENEGWYGYNQEPAFSRIVLKDGGVEITHFRGAAFGNGITRFLQVDRRGWLWRGSADGVYVSDGKDVSPDGWVHLSVAD
ncbi:MAG: hypothetical protein SFV51_30550, partial [Bryobacteraceae bacterium]|nr:hypothetical protein [Bryobacteraceae bacterium]